MDKPLLKSEDFSTIEEYTEYLKDQLEKTIKFIEYIAKHLDSTIESTKNMEQNNKELIEFIECSTDSKLKYEEFKKDKLSYIINSKISRLTN